jgi:hypothetical protein
VNAAFKSEQFRLKGRNALGLNKLPRPKSGEHFLKGPIPLSWLTAASSLPGRSLHAGIAIWFAAGLTKSRVIPLSNLATSRFGIDRSAKYRALAWLEEAGLISVQRQTGRAPTVVILDH